MSTTQIPLTPESFFAAFKSRALLLVLLGDFSGVRALRLSHLVWEHAPAWLPEFAASCLDEHQGPRTAAWDLYQAARAVAAGRELDDVPRGLN